MIAFVLLVLALLIFVNALFVAAEFATVSSRRARVAELADGGSRAARALLPVLEDRALLDRYIAACQVGITLSSLLVGYYGQAQLTPVLAPVLGNLGLPEAAVRSAAVTVLLLALTFLQVILGELLPKSVALRFPERLGTLVVRPVRWSLVLLRPLIAILNGSALLVLRRFNRSGMEESHVHHPDELEMIFRESAEGGLLDVGERDMLSNVFHLRERIARQIMVPRNRVEAVSIDAQPEEVIARLVDTPHTRFPVFDGSIDRIVGAVHLRELWALVRAENGSKRDLRQIVRKIPVVPEFLPVTEVWARMRRQGTAMAAVFDEHGGVVGIITVEDILEELFGELQDEFDDERELFREEAGGAVLVRGDLLVSEVNERFLLRLPEEPADTIGGLLLTGLGRAASKGDEVEVEGVRLRAVEVRGQAVTLVRLDTGAEGDDGGGQDGR